MPREYYWMFAVFWLIFIGFSKESANAKASHEKLIHKAYCRLKKTFPNSDIATKISG